MEASGHARWFERLLAELQFELWIGDAAEIRTKRVRKQKTDRQDAQLFCAETGEAQEITLPYCSNCDVTKPTSTVREPETATAIVLSRHRINAVMRRIRRLIEDARRKIARRAAA
jgi:uncharacterized membrane protein